MMFQVDGKNGSNGKYHDTFELNATCQLWSEAILSCFVAAFGLVGNLISIWVLSVPEMRCTAFNRLLLALAFVDIMFIAPGKQFILDKLPYFLLWYQHLFFPIFRAIFSLCIYLVLLLNDFAKFNSDLSLILRSLNSFLLQGFS